MQTLEEMTAEFEQALNEFVAETGEAADAVWYDFVSSTAFTLLTVEDFSPEAVELAREFCRTQTGSIPHDLEPYLGKKDWVQ